MTITANAVNKCVGLLASGQPIYYTSVEDRGYEGGRAAAVSLRTSFRLLRPYSANILSDASHFFREQALACFAFAQFVTLNKHMRAFFALANR